MFAFLSHFLPENAGHDRNAAFQGGQQRGLVIYYAEPAFDDSGRPDFSLWRVCFFSHRTRVQAA
jgi:hypothetical protein